MSHKLPITLADKEWVEESFAWFFQQFGTQIFSESPLILSPKDLLPHYDSEKFPDTQSVVEALCMKLAIPLEQIFFDPIYRGEIDKYGLYSGILGTYSSYIDPKTSRELYHITLNMEENIELQEIFGTLIHEFCHIKLLGENRITIYQNHDHEYLTDLLTIFWGFGVISANEAFYSGGEYDGLFMFNYIGSKGYLPLEVWAYGLALYAILQGKPRISWPNMLGEEVRHLFYICLEYLNFRDSPLELADFPLQGILPDPLKRNLLSPKAKTLLLEKDKQLLNHPSNENLWERAEQNLTLNLFLPAAQDYFQLIERDPKSPKGYSGMAKTLLKVRQLDDCQDVLYKVFQLNSQYDEARITQAHLFLLTHQIDSIFPLLSPIPSTHTHKSEAHHILAMAAYEKGDPSRALIEIAQAIALRPSYPQFFLTRGIMYLDLCDTSKSEASIDHVIKLNPKLYVAYTYKGIILRKKNKFDEAINNFNQALEVNPNDEQALWHLSLTQQRKEYFESREWIEVYHFSDLIAALPIRKKLKKKAFPFEFGMKIP